jgi:DNA replication protein DnaC
MSEAVFPFSLYNVTGRLTRLPEVARMIANDQQLFGSFFAMVYKVLEFNDAYYHQPMGPAIHDISKLISSVDAKAFTLKEIGESTKLAESIKRQLGQHVTSEYLGKFLAFCDLFFKLQSSADAKQQNVVMQAIRDIADLLVSGARKHHAGDTLYETGIEANIASVKNIYELDDAEEILLQHAALLSCDSEAFIFYRMFELACSRKGHFKILLELALFDVYYNDLDAFSGSYKQAESAVNRVLSHKTSKPLAFNIVKVSDDGMVKQLSQFWTRVITYDHTDGKEGLVKFFVTPVQQTKSYSSVIARLNEKMIPLFKDVVQTCKFGMIEQGVNILFYGPRALDKNQAFQRALEGMKYNLYEANTTHEAWGDEASITWAAQRILESKTRENLMATGVTDMNILIVHEAANVLSRGKSRGFSFSNLFEGDQAKPEKKHEDELDSDVLLLTKSCTPTFWFTTDASRLSPEAVGKFMMHLEVIPGTRADRKAEVEKIADSLNLPPEVRQALAKYMQLGAVQVETAARVVKMLELHEPESYETLLQLVEESQRALQREKTEEIRTSVTKYDLSLLNIHGKYSPEQVITALAKKGAGTLCFYGMPGTGKTQLAEYIANKLDKPLLVKRASDILSKWLGDNEQNIAEMFREAKAEGAVLLLDEADSFLRDRALSRHSWEVTMVNELLQGMERFPGIFICASNLFESLDAAAIRRFTFKFNFLELSDEQRVRMFYNEAGVAPEAGTELHDKLMMIRHLTPGDFATVKRQANLFDAVLSPEDWLKQLAEEAKAKIAGLQRNHFDVDRV